MHEFFFLFYYLSFTTRTPFNLLLNPPLEQAVILIEFAPKGGGGHGGGASLQPAIVPKVHKIRVPF